MWGLWWILLAAGQPAEFRVQLARGLETVLRAAPELFVPMRGPRIDIRPGRDSWWEARRNLPGAACRVFEHPEPSYRCRWEKSGERPDLRAFQTRLAADVEAAIGEGWRRSDAEGGAVRFVRERDGASISLAPAGRGTEASVELAVTGGARRGRFAGGER